MKAISTFLPLLLFAVASKATPTQINFRLKDSSPEALELAPLYASTQGLFKIRVPGSADGIYRFQTNLTTPLQYSVSSSDDELGFDFFVEPGDSINITLKPRQFGINLLNYTGNNTGKLIFEFFERKHFDMFSLSVENQGVMQSQSAENYARHVDALCNLKLNFLVAFDRFTRFWNLSRFYLTPEYMQYKAATYIYGAAKDKMGYTSFRAGQDAMNSQTETTDSARKKYEPSATYFAFTQKLSVNNDALVNHFEYLRYVKAVMGHRYKEQPGEKKKGADYTAGYFRFAQNHLTGATRDAVLSSIITDRYRFGDPASVEDLTNELILTTKDTSIKNGIIAIQQYYKPLSKGQPAPDFILKDLNGKNVSLSDYKNKTVLLNFTSLGCMGCRMQLPHEKKLAARFEKDSFVILKVYMGNDPDILKREIKPGAPGVVLCLPEGYESKVAKDYRISGVPEYFLIKPGGKFAVNGQSYPSNSITAIQIQETLPPQAALTDKQPRLVQSGITRPKP